MKAHNTNQATGVHCIDTEARSLDEALRILEKKRRATKAAETQLARQALYGKTKGNIRGELALALHKTRETLGQVRNPRKREKLPHPLKDLSPEAKRAKVREMYDRGHGYWGRGSRAYERLAKAFGVTKGQIVDWIFDDDTAEGTP